MLTTAYQNLRNRIDHELGGPGLTPDARIRDAIRARRCRNLFFSAMGPVLFGGAQPADVLVQAQTQPFGAPIVVTDILNFDQPYDETNLAITITPFQLMRLFLSGVGYQEDFFGAGNFLDVMRVLGHYQVNSLTNGLGDAPSLKMHFAPFLMRPGQIFQANWEYLDINTAAIQVNPEVDFRALEVLGKDDVYGKLCGPLLDTVCAYVNRYDSETFILDLRIPEASFPAATETKIFQTEQQERPILIYGIGTNINGAQVTLRDDSVQWEFCVAPTPPTQAINNGVLQAGVYPGIRGLPINVLAGNADLTLHEAYNMLPVPHLLAPNTSLLFSLTNGLRPLGSAATYAQSINTNNNAAQTTGDGHIALLCRTV